MMKKEHCNKTMALETLKKVKEIYDTEGDELLCAGFWSEFMHLCNEQILQIEKL